MRSLSTRSCTRLRWPVGRVVAVMIGVLLLFVLPLLLLLLFWFINSTTCCCCCCATVCGCCTTTDEFVTSVVGEGVVDVEVEVDDGVEDDVHCGCGWGCLGEGVEMTIFTCCGCCCEVWKFGMVLLCVGMLLLVLVVVVVVVGGSNCCCCCWSLVWALVRMMPLRTFTPLFAVDVAVAGCSLLWLEVILVSLFFVVLFRSSSSDTWMSSATKRRICHRIQSVPSGHETVMSHSCQWTLTGVALTVLVFMLFEDGKLQSQYEEVNNKNLISTFHLLCATLHFFVFVGNVSMARNLRSSGTFLRVFSGGVGEWKTEMSSEQNVRKHFFEVANCPHSSLQPLPPPANLLCLRKLELFFCDLTQPDGA